MRPRGALGTVVEPTARASATPRVAVARPAAATPRPALAAADATEDATGTADAVASTTADAALARRAELLSRRYLGGHARPVSVRWVDGMDQRWGSCTVLEGRIRLSRRLSTMPGFVRDYVLLHELGHLLVAGHGPDFWTLLRSYPHLDRARGFLDGVDHAVTDAPTPPERR